MVKRVDMISDEENPAHLSDQFSAHIIWMHSDEMLPGRHYIFKFATQSVVGEVTDLRHDIDVNSLEHHASKTLQMNQVGLCNIALDHAIAFDPFDDCADSGSFIIIDRLSNITIGAGMINFGLRRATNLVWQEIDIDKNTRADQKKQRPCILWFTGLSGSGKSTTANIVEKKLHALGRHSYILDGDNVRHGLNKDLGFTDADRVENIRRVAETAKLFVDAGLVVLVSFISPFRSERRLARDLVEDHEFIEVFIDTPLEVCEDRDPKGLYQKARAGQIKNFTGIDSDYEAPENAEIHLNTVDLSPEESAEAIIDYLKNQGFLKSSEQSL